MLSLKVSQVSIVLMACLVLSSQVVKALPRYKRDLHIPCTSKHHKMKLILTFATDTTVSNPRKLGRLHRFMWELIKDFVDDGVRVLDLAYSNSAVSMNHTPCFTTADKHGLNSTLLEWSLHHGKPSVFNR